MSLCKIKQVIIIQYIFLREHSLSEFIFEWFPNVALKLYIVNIYILFFIFDTWRVSIWLSSTNISY